MISPDDAINFLSNLSEPETTTVTEIPESNINDTMADIFFERLALMLNVYYTPFLIVLGCLGNFISIIVFFRSKLRLQSTSQYLTALALSDTLFLCQLLPPWLKAVGASAMFSKPGYCQLFVYLSYVTCNHSSWLVVAFTVERFVAVVYPLRRNAMCTVKRARHIIASLAAAALLLNLPVVRFAVPSDNDCNIDERLLSHAALFNLVDTALSFTLPLAVIVILNAWIMWGVWRVSRARPDLMRQRQEEQQQWPGRPRQPRSVRASACQRSQQRITRMLLIVSSVFVLLNLPAYTMRIVAYANNMGENEYSGKWAALQQVCLLFFNTNFGINFALYCLTGQNFRRALQETFPFLRRRRLVQFAMRGRGGDRNARTSSGSTSFVHSFSESTTNCTFNSVCGRGTLGQPMVGHGMAAHSTAVHGIVGHASGGQSGMVYVGDGRSCGRRTGTEHFESQPPTRIRRQPQKVLQRWTFDNTKQYRKREAGEQTSISAPTTAM